MEERFEAIKRAADDRKNFINEKLGAILETMMKLSEIYNNLNDKEKKIKIGDNIIGFVQSREMRDFYDKKHNKTYKLYDDRLYIKVNDKSLPIKLESTGFFSLIQPRKEDAELFISTFKEPIDDLYKYMQKPKNKLSM
jgi:hypothetical protein